VPDGFIDQIFEVMHLAWWHTFIILTKRAVRICDYCSLRYIPNQLAVLPNVWLGVSIENQPTADNRITWLLNTPAAVRFVSVEPMLGEVDLDKHEFLCETWSKGGITIGTYLDWVICGCESGPGARPMDLDWARRLRDQCQAAGVPFFLKQANIDGKLVKMPALDGVIWDQHPIIDNNYAENR
jgi:protein gp37